jgi:hypothetical protein
MNHVYIRLLPTRFCADTIIISKALELAPWVALAYAVLGQDDRASDTLTAIREVRDANTYRIGPGCTRKKSHRSCSISPGAALVDVIHYGAAPRGPDVSPESDPFADHTELPGVKPMIDTK